MSYGFADLIVEQVMMLFFILIRVVISIAGVIWEVISEAVSERRPALGGPIGDVGTEPEVPPEPKEKQMANYVDALFRRNLMEVEYDGSSKVTDSFG